MSGFPSAPVDGQQETINGITYFYSSDKTAWLRVATTGADLTANTLTVTSNTAAVSTTTGAVLVTGGVGIQGNVYANKFVGDGSQLTGLPAGYTDSDVADYLPTHTGEITASTVYANLVTTDSVVANSMVTARIDLTQPFYYNSRTVNANVTIGATENAMSAGPITIASGVTVTIEPGGEWTVV